jgi:hypothetical protein
MQAAPLSLFKLDASSREAGQNSGIREFLIIQHRNLS